MYNVLSNNVPELLGVGTTGWLSKSFVELGGCCGDFDGGVKPWSSLAVIMSLRSLMEKLFSIQFVNDGWDGSWMWACFNICKFLLIIAGSFGSLQWLTLRSVRRQLNQD